MNRRLRELTAKTADTFVQAGALTISVMIISTIALALVSLMIHIGGNH